MTSEELIVEYVEKINKEILQNIDYDKLDSSCNSNDTSYAAKNLKELHQAFVDVYGGENPDGGIDFVFVPAVLRGRTTKHLGIGMVMLDLSSAGEHYGTSFLTPLGVIDDGDPNISLRDMKYINKKFNIYDYWYTTYIERDHHVDFENVPTPVADILNQVYDLLHPEQGDIKMG